MILKGSRGAQLVAQTHRRRTSSKEKEENHGEYTKRCKRIGLQSQRFERPSSQVQAGSELQSEPHDRHCIAVQEFECGCGRGRAQTTEKVQKVDAE